MSSTPSFENFLSYLANRGTYFSEFYGSTLPHISAPKNTPSTDSDYSSFLEQNSAYWETVLSRESTQDTQGALLVDATFDWRPGIHIVCTLGNYIASARNLEPVCLVSGKDDEKMTICQSYHSGKFISLSTASYSNRTIANATVTLARYYATLDTPSDLFDISIDSVPLGDLIYGTIMRKSGSGTISSVGATTYKHLFSSILRHNHLSRIFNRLNVEGVIATHKGYIQGGLIARIAVKNDADVYVPKGGPRTLRKFESMEEINWEATRPSRKLFREIFENYRPEAIDQADEFLKDRLGVTPESTFNPNKKCREQFLGDYDVLSVSKPTVLILPHIFIEFLRNDGRLFQDYLTWFRETIRFASRTSEVNWLVKPHPGRHRFQDDMKQDSRSEVNEILGDRSDHSVAIIPEDTPINHLISSVDAITTMDGTAGVEYPCYGIPVVLASESTYSGFGYAHEPKSKKEYFELLDSIGKVPKLTEIEIERAKIMCYIQFILIQKQWSAFPDEAGAEWKNAVTFLERVKESNLEQNVSTFVENDRKHLIDQSIEEFLDN